MSHPSQSKHQASDVERGSHDSQPGGNPKDISAKLRSCYDLTPQPIGNTPHQMSEKFDIEETTWRCRLYIAAYLIVVLMHPLHYYVYVIKPEQNCLETDNELHNTIAIVLFFNAYMLLYTRNFIRKLFKTGPTYKTMKYHLLHSNTSIVDGIGKVLS
ncbi:uncharacterized protein LOC123226750 [Mangifera indica]|uniref:uncharacterized protein LOC123226750 n=1 Tax=Mangifera indica TaxID=29780 RepID=UPI001CF9FE24|nr:uncharacterized protein LOC123226750 [Mangifera indica]